MNRLIMNAALAFAVAFAPAASAEMIDGAKFRKIEEGAWYHPVEPADWAYSGADEQTIYRVLERIETASGERANPDQPDTVIAYGPGHWVYEFTAAGDEAMAAGKYHAAIVYYHTAAAPHLGTPEQTAALEKAYDAYAAAMRGIGHYEEVEIGYMGGRFTAHLHLPDGDGPFPLLVMSNGSDVSSVMTLSYYAEHLAPKGIAFLTLDLPGMGHSAAFDAGDGNLQKLHVAALEWAFAQDTFDRDNVFLQGISMGGAAAASVLLGHPEFDLAGVIYVCGPLHDLFVAPPESYASFPKFTVDGTKTRLGLPTDADNMEFAHLFRAWSVDKFGFFDETPIETPFLAINTNDDPVAPVEEMDRILARTTHGERVVFDMPGHCPPDHLREMIASHWIVKNLR